MGFWQDVFDLAVRTALSPSWVALPWHSPVPLCFHRVGFCHEHGQLELPSATGAEEKLFKLHLELKLDKESALPHRHKIN